MSSTFSTGTGHGYIGIYEIIASILKENLTFDNYLVHDNAQAGIKHIVEKAFPGKNIIYLHPELIYTMTHLKLVPIKHHYYFYNNATEETFIKTNITPLIHQIFLRPTPPIHRVAVIKTNEGQNMTSIGMFEHSLVLKLCREQNIVYVDPKDMTESSYFNMLYAAENIIFSFGTTHFKGLLYVSDQCKTITILVHPQFIQQYNGFKSNKIKNYKNAVVNYVILEKECDLYF